MFETFTLVLIVIFVMLNWRLPDRTMANLRRRHDSAMGHQSLCGGVVRLDRNSYGIEPTGPSLMNMTADQ